MQMFFLSSDFSLLFILILFLLIFCFLLVMLSCNYALYSIIGGCCCFILLIFLLGFFEINSFIIFVFLVYSSFFLVVFLCVVSFIDDSQSFEFWGVVYFCLSIFFLAIIDILVYYISCTFLNIASFSYNICDLSYFGIVSELSDISLLGDLLFKEYPFLVLVAGMFLFIGILCVPLLCNYLFGVKGTFLRSKNKKVLKGSLKKK